MTTISQHADLRSALQAALACVSSDPPEPIGLSAAAGSYLADALRGRRITRRPVVRGRTVWAAGEPAAVVVAETPNALGRLEAQPVGTTCVLIREAAAPAPEWRSDVTISPSTTSWALSTDPKPSATADEAAAFRSRTRWAERLAKRLNQIPGVVPAFRTFESPTSVVVVPTEAEGIAQEARVPDAIEVDAPKIPGLPGALRFRIVAEPTYRALQQVADAVRAAVESRNEGPE